MSSGVQEKTSEIQRVNGRFRVQKSLWSWESIKTKLKKLFYLACCHVAKEQNLLFLKYSHMRPTFENQDTLQAFY